MKYVDDLEASMQEMSEHVLALHKDRQALQAQVQSLESELHTVRKRARMLILALTYRLLNAKVIPRSSPPPPNVETAEAVVSTYRDL